LLSCVSWVSAWMWGDHLYTSKTTDCWRLEISMVTKTKRADFRPGTKCGAYVNLEIYDRSRAAMLH
jgi:hypothetical protein